MSILFSVDQPYTAKSGQGSRFPLHPSNELDILRTRSGRSLEGPTASPFASGARLLDACLFFRDGYVGFL